MQKICGPRALSLDEFESLQRLQDTVFHFGPNRSMFDEFPTLFSPENRERLRVISDGDEIVSAICYQVRPAIIYGTTLSIASLGAVCTYENYRGHGFATQLLDDSFAAARAEGADVMFISGQRGLYQRAGCAIAGHEHRFTLTRAEIDSVSHDTDVAVSSIADSDTESLAAIQRTEPVRFVRSPEDWRAFATRFRLVRPDMPEPFGVTRCWIVRVNNIPVAYVILTVDRSKENRITAHIVEFAGARRYVFAGIAQIAKDFSVESVEGSLLPGDIDGHSVLAEMGVKTNITPLGGHRFSILHANILDRYRNWLVERVGSSTANTLSIQEESDTWWLVSDDARIAVGNLERMNEVLFGDAVHLLDGPDETLAIWRTAFPLPWLKPGLNYI